MQLGLNLYANAFFCVSTSDNDNATVRNRPWGALVAESNVHPEVDAQKRRTTRIVQAVPLTVTGVDALGRPFQERTSTLIINCHGCRYQSKHYVLKNMWVTFEVPHNEAGREPRTVRARVTWIQRPRTVRELFQIGVDLEVSGNVWGIAFPPADWFPFPEAGVQAVIPSPAESTETTQPAQEWVPAPQAVPSLPEPPEDNVRVLPMPGGGEASLQMARQMARLVVEAKQQVQSTVRETASRAVAAETRPLLAALQDQLKDAAEKSVEAAVAAHMERMQREGIQRMEQERAEGVAAMRTEWSRERDRLLADARMQIDAQLVEVERKRRMDFESQIQIQLDAAVEKLQSLSGSVGANAGEVREAIEQLRRTSEEAAAVELQRWQELMDQRTAEAQERFAVLERSTKNLGDRIAVEAATAESGWRGLLEADLSAGTARWNEKLETSMENAARQFTERIARTSETSTRQLEEQLQQRVGMIGSSFSQVTSEAEGALGALRASLGNELAGGQAAISELHKSLELFETGKSDIARFIQTASEEMARRGEALLDAHGKEINRHAESAAAGFAEQLTPILESTGHQTIERLGHELEERLRPQIVQVTELLSKLAFDQAQAEKALQEHQTRLWQASERTVQDSVTRSKEVLALVEQEFAESARHSSAKWFAELEAKATETTHATFEALYKSADWYEKKVQMQMQSTLEKGVEQAAAGLREKAGEFSSQFATELDHYSRSYVEHAQTQMGENARDAAEKASQQIRQIGDNGAEGFVERAAQLGREQLEQFNAKANSTFDQHAQRVEAHSSQLRSKLESDARTLAGEFQRALSQQTQQSLAQGKQELASQVDQAKDALRTEAQTLESRLRASQQSSSAQAMEEYKQRLENASNSWLLTTVTKLNQQSETLISQLADSTEKRLRATCNNVIADMGETLRQRLSGLFIPGSAPAPAPPNPPQTKPDEK